MTGVKQFREVLIFVAGATPQIITETIYALAMQEPPIYADELHIITHSRGRQLILQKLVKDGILEQLCSEYGLPRLKLETENILVIKDETGKELEDIRTVDDNELAGDQIAEFIRNKASQPSVRLHCSLSGGRKTMTYYMGIAFQLFARQWDQLYHVMVAPEFEKVEQFFYPPKQPQNLSVHTRLNDVVINTADAEVTLTPLPLIYLRDKIPLTGHSVRELVSEGQKNIDSAAVQGTIRVNLAERTLYIDDTLIELPPTQLMIYTAFLRLKHGACKFNTRKYCQECTACFVTVNDMTEQPFIEAMADDYQLIYNNDSEKRDELVEKWHNRLDSENLRQQFSKINKVIKTELNNELLNQFYHIYSEKKYGGSRYGIKLDKSRIAIN